MQIVRDLGGYSLGRSDMVRRAMSKKKHSVMEQERKNFIYGIVDEDGNVEVPGCLRNGISEKAANEIFDETLDENIDIYQLISNELYPGEVCTEERREGIKALHMSAYFDEGSDKYLGKNVYFRMDKEDVDKKEVDEFIGKMKEAVIKVEGGALYGNEIFYVESCVYLMTVYDLLCRL